MAYTDSHAFNVIIALLIPLNMIWGVLKRFSSGHAIAAFLNITFMPAFALLDIITVIFADELLFTD